MEYKRTATTYFIPPGKFLLLENALGNPDLIQSSVSSDCRVTIVDRENFPLDELEQWPTFRLTSADIKLKLGSGQYHIYIAVPSTDNTDTATAFVSYSAKPVDSDGYEVIPSVDEDGNPTTQKGSLLGKSGFKYYSFGTVSARGENPSAITVPAGQGRYIVVDLGVNPQDSYLDKKVDWSYLNKMFIPHFDDPSDPEKLTWIEAKSHMGIQGGVSSFLEGEDLDLPSIYDGLPIDNQTLFWEETDGVRVLKSKGSGSGEGSFGRIETVDNGGNAITKVEVVKGDEENPDKLVFFKNLTFVEKSYVDNNFYNKTYSDNNFAKASELKSLQTSFNDFLTGTDSDNIVNKWKELEAFLSNMTESDNLASILSNKAEKTALESLSKVVETKWTKDDTKILNWDTAFGWGDHSKAGYALKTYVDETFIGIKGDYTIEGTKNFVGSLQVNGCPIVYDAQKKYWKLEGDLLVTGGLSTFSSDLEFDPSTIMDGINCDEVTIHVNEYGQLEVIGGTGGEVDEDAVKEIIESYGFATSSELPKFNTSDFSVSGGIVSLKGASVKIVSSSDSMSETDVLYVIV